MTPFPLVLTDHIGATGEFLAYVLIGFAFGATLEMAGFGKSTKLAAQFYFKEMTVLKVMFTAIVVAMVLVLLTTSIGLLDYNLIWVNPTYLWPGIVGGFIMGIGFIIGGFCPGTSLVSAATLKIDGMMFVLGVFFGIFMFGETVSQFDGFWHSSYMGRYTIQDMLNVDAGVVALVVVIGAVAAFYLSEIAERTFGDKENPISRPKWRYGAAGALVTGAVALVIIGQPSTADKWEWLKDEQQPRLEARAVYIHPAELLTVMHDNRSIAWMVDVRDEADYNRFHILDAQNIPLDTIPDHLEDLRAATGNTAVIIMSNDEASATEAWRIMIAESVPNVYILEGGVNNWIATFGDQQFLAEHPVIEDAADDDLGYFFSMALGARYSAANPNPDLYESLMYTAKVEFKAKRGASGGGCG